MILYSDEQRQLYRDRLDDLNTEKKNRKKKITKSERPPSTSHKDQANP